MNIEIIEKVVTAIATDKSAVIMTPKGQGHLLSAMIRVPDAATESFVDKEEPFDFQQLTVLEALTSEKLAAAQKLHAEASSMLQTIATARAKITDTIREKFSLPEASSNEGGE